jgi:hypothetical protein
MLTQGGSLGVEESGSQGAADAPNTQIATEQTEPGLRPFVVVGIVVAAIQALLMIYALARAFAWDEGFHMLAAQLINRGQKPYLDFCFPQTPLNAYWNAFWMRLFGESWQITHVVAALLTAGAILMAADYLLTRFPARRWRLACALVVALIVGLNPAVVEFGTVGQAYGICMFLLVAGFRVAIVAVARRGIFWTVLAALLVSTAAGCSLLTAPAVLVLLVWMLLYNQTGSRLMKLGAFLTGAAIPFLPMLWLFWKAPYPVYFNLLGYHLFFRRVKWEGSGIHDFEVLSSWINSGATLFLLLLGAAGVFFVARRSGWDRALRAEYYLCAWIVLLAGAQIALSRPTFAWYFIVIVPLLGILAAAGFYSIGSRLYGPDRPKWAVAVLASLMLFGLMRSLYDDYGSLTWHDMDALAKKSTEVTKPNGSLWADEHIYFLMKRPPPDGMEFAPAHKLDMELPLASRLHILPGKELDRQVKAGMFDTVAICEDDDRIKELGLADLYDNKVDVASCAVYWDKKNQ